MANQVINPNREEVIDDREGNVYRLFTFILPDTSSSHELECGERGISAAATVVAPSGSLTYTAPAGSGVTAGLSSGDQSTRVIVNGSSGTAGVEYKTLVVYQGRNAAAL